MKLFGTDGLRGKAGEYPLDPASVRLLGRELGGRLAGSGSTRVVVGGDTRESTPAIVADLAAGLREGGCGVASAGVITTPGIAELVLEIGAAAGVAVSASHNPYEDNGIKIFGPDGRKWPDAEEEYLEKKLVAGMGTGAPQPTPGAAGPRSGPRRDLHLASEGRRAGGPRRPARAPRCGQRRRVPDRAPGPPPRRGARHRDPRRARRAQHQPRLRRPPPPGHGGEDARGRCGAGRRVRWGRRPGDLRRRDGPHPGRRRRALDRRLRLETKRQASPGRRRRHGHVQLRPGGRPAAGRHRVLAGRGGRPQRGEADGRDRGRTRGRNFGARSDVSPVAGRRRNPHGPGGRVDRPGKRPQRSRSWRP